MITVHVSGLDDCEAIDFAALIRDQLAANAGARDRVESARGITILAEQPEQREALDGADYDVTGGGVWESAVYEARVLALRPFCETGPGYRRAVVDALNTSARMRRLNRIPESEQWLVEAEIAGGVRPRTAIDLTGMVPLTYG